MANSDEKRLLPKTVQIVEMAKRTAIAMKSECYLVLDAVTAIQLYCRRVTIETRTAVANMLKNNLYGFAKDWITQLIQQKQKRHKHNGSTKKAA